jgi:hypothetical protein
VALVGVGLVGGGLVGSGLGSRLIGIEVSDHGPDSDCATADRAVTRAARIVETRMVGAAGRGSRVVAVLCR